MHNFQGAGSGGEKFFVNSRQSRDDAAMARIVAADFSYRSLCNLKLAIGAPSSDRYGINGPPRR